MSGFKSFGNNPAGKRISLLEKSKNFKKGSFENTSATMLMASNSALWKNMWKFINKPKYTAPASPLPSVKTDLKSFKTTQPVIIWFGHSSYFIHINGKNILVDPVLSGHASPFSFGARSFAGSDIYSVEDLPAIDLLILTHDHYDHLDYRTVLGLKPNIKKIITSLGVSSHLLYWGFDEKIITELDWWESSKPTDDIEITAAPARHFSGRTFRRNKTLWSSFILEAGGYKIYIGGDSGYDSHFKQIGEQQGPFDIALLEAGQYNLDWPQIHMMPEETVQAAIDLKAKVLMPVHWAKFSLSLHPWDEPVKRVAAKAKEAHVDITTPMIGEPVVLGESYPAKTWWEDIRQ